MHRITGTYVDPNANGPGKAGFTEGEPGVRGATVVKGPWCNSVQEEIALSVEDAGMVLDPNNNNQLTAAIRALADTEVHEGPATFQGLQTFNNGLRSLAAIQIDAGDLVSNSGSLSINNADASDNFKFIGTLPQRSKEVSPMGASATAGWAPAASGGYLSISSPSTSEFFQKQVEFPHGATVFSLVVQYYQQVNTTQDLAVALVSRDYATWTETEHLTVVAQQFGVIHDWDASIGAFVVDNTARAYFLKGISADAGADECQVYWARAWFTDPGPRNY